MSQIGHMLAVGITIDFYDRYDHYDCFNRSIELSRLLSGLATKN
jgi:hypothetical protein